MFAVTSVASGAEATKYYYEDGVNIKVNMTSDVSLRSCLSHVVVTIIAVVFKYYRFVVKAKQDGE
eukprot:5226953-Pyramimonas_sp.AAC.1